MPRGDKSLCLQRISENSDLAKLAPQLQSNVGAFKRVQNA
jgi:hypothetical protein